MSKLPGVLGDYVTISMAVELLGFSREQTGRFYALVKKGLTKYKVGGMTLARFDELAELAGLPADASPPWPAELAELAMSDLYSRNEVADILSVSPRTVNRQADRGAIGRVDLSEWGGYALYQVSATDPIPKYMYVGDWQIAAHADDRGRLRIALDNERLEDPFMMLGAASRSKMAFVHDDDMRPARAIVRLSKELYE